MWHVYIIRCSDNTFYTGSTKDITRRLKEHNAGRGGRYTRMRRPVELLYKEALPNRASAQKRESTIKSYARARKEKLIKEG